MTGYKKGEQTTITCTLEAVDGSVRIEYRRAKLVSS